MTHYQCENLPSCANFQSAICLHCNRRLCLVHITEHNEAIPSSVQNLLNEVDVTAQQINNEYEKSREAYNNALKVLNQWRTQQTENIQQLYDNHLQSIESQQEALSIIQQDLSELLDRDARQPLKHIHKQQNVTTGTMNHIRETIEKAQRNCVQLKWTYSISAPANVVYDPKDILSVPNTVSSSKSNDNQTIRKRKFSSRFLVNLRKYRAFRRLVDIFADLSAVEQGREHIDSYLKMQGPNFKLPILVCSYLTAWHRLVEEHEKNFLLSQHISTIRVHTAHLRHSFVTLFGIHAFFFNENIQGNKREMMTFILQYFIDHQCLSRNQVVNWYNSRDLDGYEGFDGVKQLTTPFIKSLWICNNAVDGQTTSTNSTTFIEPFEHDRIKEEIPESNEDDTNSS